MSQSNESQATKLAELQQRLHSQLVDKVEQVELLWHQLINNDWTAASLEGIRLLVHNLAGSGTLLGNPHVSATASTIERALNQLRQAQRRPDTVEQKHLTEQIAQLGRLGRSPINETARSELLPLMSQQPTATHAAEVFIVEDDIDQARELARQITNFGYIVHVFDQPSQAVAAAGVHCPHVILMDMVFPESDDAGAQTAQLLRTQSHCDVPVVFMSQRTDFHSRLQAIRSGAQAYFTKPVNIGILIDKLDVLTKRQQTEPYHVLIVDDSQLTAEIHAKLLYNAGFKTTTVTDATRVLDLLYDSQPDLILLDMYMPLCNGHELAAIIRQQPEFTSLPIVFLSSEHDRQLQLDALDQGADDFLTKPIKAEHLISAVSSRIRRARVMRSQMIRDGLTGLFNHSITKEYLRREVSRARRYDSALTIALLDLDHFKQVNDSYGHTAGDQVLKSLARMLTQRLRRSDIIGRYGGEEFAVIMPETPGTAAINVLDDIRERFAQVLHQAGNNEFTVTFSGGVATLAAFTDASTLNEQADIALYQAKRKGRNQIVLAGTSKKSITDRGNLAGADQQAEPYTILIIDSHSELRTSVPRWLKEKGHRVVLASDRATGWNLFRHARYDIVLVDIATANLSPAEIITELHTIHPTSAVILMAIPESLPQAINAANSSVVDYLQKPFTKSELHTMIEHTLYHLRLNTSDQYIPHRHDASQA
jgi:diguanylate cyclase (GGDEF)-like protein